MKRILGIIEWHSFFQFLEVIWPLNNAEPNYPVIDSMKTIQRTT